ncbi:hypothetical protein PFISCL1PPCAC_3409, partial [Pristionchus fissidentatus]
MTGRAVFLGDLLKNSEVLVSRWPDVLFLLRLLITLLRSEMAHEKGPDLVLMIFVLISDRIHPRTIECCFTSESELIGEVAIDCVRLTERLAVHFEDRHLTERRG